MARRLALCVALSFLHGCAGIPESTAPEPMFYPPPPNAPRIQFLRRFSDADDIAGARSGFSEFLLGKHTPDSDVIKKPYGVAMHDGRLYAVDTRGPGYAVFDLKQRRFHIVTGAETAGGRMRKPINITVDNDGTKYVTDTGRDQVLMFDRADRYVRAYGADGQFKPTDAVATEDRLYVADVAHHRIHVLDKRSGQLLFDFGKPGSREGELYKPTNLALSADGRLYVADTGNFRIQEFTLDGRFVRSLGDIGNGLGQFARPKGLAIDRAGRLYVADAAFENIQVFDPDGKLLMFFGEPGERPANINLPAAVAIDYDSAALFQKYAHPKFKLEYVILVASQFGANKVNVFGFGRMADRDYPLAERSPPP